MHIQHVEIGNFRKLQAVRVDFSETTTIFVGANNSGKTSAMVALRQFLVDRYSFSVNDFTLTHWPTIDAAGAQWEAPPAEPPARPFDWGSVCPYLDVWLNVPTEEIHYVQKLLPTLDWNGEHIGVRLRLEPKDPAVLRQEYVTARDAAALVMAKAAEAPASAEISASAEAATALVTAVVETPASTFALWPLSLMNFLSRRLSSSFEVRTYILDPKGLKDPEKGEAQPQALPAESEPIEGDPFKGLIRIDEISAQRGFGHAGSMRPTRDDVEDDEPRGGKKLSSQLRSYFTQHLDPFDKPEPKDFRALQALHAAQIEFEARLVVCFGDALKELEEIGYPGVTDPKLTITSSIKPVESLNHGSAVQYEIPTFPGGETTSHRLPEESNGLGYQNLVSIVFALMSFRDKWMKVGKAGIAVTPDDVLIPPLHLVLIEEPEAHLHAQVQQVFITQAYAVLRKHDKLKDSMDLRTQLIVSTHSSHLAHEAEFASLRYFRRLAAPKKPGAVPISTVVNLSKFFNDQDQTDRFVKRYLKATHCDLFFADGAVLVEGPAERILVPHFVRERSAYAFLRSRYIAWLEIGGSHAHRLRTLLEHLGLTTLIITDIDAKDAMSRKSVVPERNAGQHSRNETLRGWIPGEQSLDSLLDAKPEDKIKTDVSGNAIRVAYQQPVMMIFKAAPEAEALPNTFEDALVYENLDLFSALEGNGLITKFRDALGSAHDIRALANEMFDALAKGEKAQFALDLLYSENIAELKVPTYIHDGLDWLAKCLQHADEDVTGKTAGTAA
jgi:predicted ATP-dependent endonuclease of OLD family